MEKSDIAPVKFLAWGNSESKKREMPPLKGLTAWKMEGKTAHLCQLFGLGFRVNVFPDSVMQSLAGHVAGQIPRRDAESCNY